MSARLRALIEVELARESNPEAQAMAARLAARPGVAAVLFYGARLRGAPDTTGRGGPLDFYVLTDSDSAYHGTGLAALANWLLPPNVYFEVLEGPPHVEAKVAVASMAAFRARMRPQALDTSFWARFAQPVALVWARSPTDRSAAIDAVAAAVTTAAWWAVRLAPEDARGTDIWRALFRHTYGSELRVEGGGRADGIVSAAPRRYSELADLLFTTVPEAERNSARRGWALRRVLGKLRNVARLAKAAFTYRGGLAYALGKVERHSGRPVELKPWERRWPWLAAPLVFWRLWREGRLR
jgi:hypothetical protein